MPTPLAVDAGTRVAVLAGAGDLPLMIADSVARRGGRVHLVAIEGAAGSEVTRYPHTWVNMAQAGRMFRALRGESEPAATHNLMVIAGAVTRPDILKLRPDLGLAPVLFEILSFISAGGDDALLTKAIRLFERRGLTVVGVQDIAPELLIGEGNLGRHDADAAARRDIARAGDVLDALSDFDVGQGAVVAGGRVLAIEGVEGTDRMLERLAQRGPVAKAVLVKSPKARQERRVDLPTIGLRTIAKAHAAGICGIAVIAGQSIGLQRDAMVGAADQSGLFIAGIAATQRTHMPIDRPRFHVDTFGRHTLRVGDRADAEQGAHAVLKLARFDSGQAAAVIRGHVLGIAEDETLDAFVARQRRPAPWGLARFNRRRGALVVRALDGDTVADVADVVHRTADAGFAALAFVVGDGGSDAPFRGASTAADHAGLALVALRISANTAACQHGIFTTRSRSSQ